MLYLVSCNNAVLGVFFKIAKALLALIQILGPLLAICSLVMTLVKMAQNPEDKKLPKKIFNSCLALCILFFIPLLITVVLNMVDDSTDFGACWKSSSNGFGNAGYINTDNDNRVNIIGNSKYESGVVGSTNNRSSSSTTSNSTSSSSSSSSHSGGVSNSSSGTSTSTSKGVIGTHVNSKNGIVYNLYNQASDAWKGHNYSSGQTIAQNGCMNTSVAVVSSGYDKSITPVTVFNKYRHSHPRTAISGLTGGAYSCSSGSTSKNNIVNTLSAGNVVVIKVYGKNKGGSSSFTSSQHYMALIDINGSNVFIGNAYSNSTHGKAGWFDIDKVLTSIQTADHCYPSSSVKVN